MNSTITQHERENLKELIQPKVKVLDGFGNKYVVEYSLDEPPLLYDNPK